MALLKPAPLACQFEVYVENFLVWLLFVQKTKLKMDKWVVNVLQQDLVTFVLLGIKSAWLLILWQC